MAYMLYAWLALVAEEAGASLLYDATRPRQLTAASTPRRPSQAALVCFLGRSRKDRALRYLFPDNPSRKVGGFNLRVDHRTWPTERPILFADGDPLRDCQLPDTELLARDEPIPITWSSDPALPLQDVIVARCLLPFAHVTCIFAADLGGLPSVRRLLNRWAVAGRDATRPSLQTRIIVLVDADEVSESDGQALFQQLDGSELYASVHLLPVSRGDVLSDEARYRPVKEEILKALDWATRERVTTQTSFLACHLARFLEGAIRHTAQDHQKPFDLIAAGRPQPRPAEWAACIGDFLERTQAIGSETQDQLLASSLLLDAYPPDTHGFHPRDLFRQRYRQPCLDALRGVACSAAATARADSIESRLVDAHACLLDQDVIPLALHVQHLTEWRAIFERLHSNRTCLGCLLCRPQHPLPCGHALCDRCIERYGRPAPRRESAFVVETCPLCQAPCVTSVVLLPPTAAVRALAVDGGGVRGVIPIRILLGLQLILGPKCSLPGLIDVAFGTSAGGLIILDIFAKHRSVTDCLEAFQRLLFHFFQGPPCSRLFSWPRRMIRSALGRGLYDANELESLLRAHYSDTQRLFSPESRSETKVAVTTTTEDGTALVTNYKAATLRPRNVGYRSVLAKTPEEEPLLWQSARATSAVPLLFRPLVLPALGACWDGGLRHNNPVALCRQELQYMWSWQPPLGILISIGTGTRGSRANSPGPERSCAPAPRSHFVWPVLRSFLETMDGKTLWDRFRNQAAAADQDALSRLDICLAGPEPRLDAAHAMDDLIRQTVEQGVGRQGRQCLLRLLAQSLFFELVSVPERETGTPSYWCVGTIRCRVSGEVFLSAIQRVDACQMDYVVGGKPLGISVTDGATCARCGRYCVPVRFRVRRLSDTVSLSLRLDDGRQVPVGGFPNPMDWFLHRQGLSLADGVTEPGAASRDECVACERRLALRRGLRVTRLKARRMVQIAHAIACAAEEAQVTYE
nr:hypothetical protein ANI_1_2628074 [Aspergillus niger CBS 513.88]|eukprot:XP_001393324.2 hypothetical protein ANI_1_2628074 [Aspergillus niger CBS 513.88]